MVNYLNINKLTYGEPYALYRKVIWVYLFLLIFEGALRKWFLPSLATPLLIVRDPIAIWLTIVGWKKGWLKNGYVEIMMIASTVSFFLTLLVGHHNLLVALFGWRIYFFHFPMIFVMGRILSRTDILKIGRFILWISIPMTVLIVVQFYSPQTAWVNLGVGGEGTAGFGGALGYMRPPGTFSFIAGYVAFQAVACCYLLYYLVMNDTLPAKYRFSNITLMVLVACYLLSIPMSIARTHFFQTCVILFFFGVAIIRKENLKKKFFKFIFLVFIACIVLAITGIADTGLDAFTVRFEGANESEGGLEGVLGNRYLGGFIRGLMGFDIPWFGYGIGLGTNAGSHMMGGTIYSFGFNGEVEWERIVGECGIIIGWAIIGVRLLFSLKLCRVTYMKMLRCYDLLPWMLSAGMMLTVPQGQWATPTNLGFSILLGGLTLAAIKGHSVNKVTID